MVGAWLLGLVNLTGKRGTRTGKPKAKHPALAGQWKTKVVAKLPNQGNHRKKGTHVDSLLGATEKQKLQIQTQPERVSTGNRKTQIPFASWGQLRNMRISTQP